MMNALINSYLGQYRIISVIGRGSTSVIYKGYQPSLNRAVAIKVLLRNLDPQFASRFRREAQAIAQLQHPNILPIYDYGEQDGLHYFVMQYIENGVTLNDIISHRPIEPLPALRLMSRLLDALDYAHRRGVIHRDIKPSNVLMPLADWPMLADFGIAKLIDDSQSLTPAGQTVGTAAYMAPERAASRAVDARTDLYSAGVVLYEMLTGQVPFDATTPIAVLMKHVNEPPPPPRSVNPSVPEVVEKILLRALEKDPDARYQTAAAMGQDVQRAIGQVERARVLDELMRTSAVALPSPSSTAPVANPPSQAKGRQDTRYKTGKLPPLDEPAGAGVTNVQRHSTTPRPMPTPAGAILAIALVLALGGLVAMIGLGGLSGLSARAGQPTPLVTATPGMAATGAPVAGEAPPTSAPPPAELPTSAPPPTEPPIPEPTALPPTEPPVPTPVPPAPTPVPTIAAEPVPPVQSDGVTTFLLEDNVWQGGYRYSAGRTYGGRTATWIYGAGTEYSTMRAAFDVPAQPAGTAELSIEGMDSEGPAKTLISIQVNGVEIYRDANPLPDDDQPLETGTWATASWSFDAALLRPGRNEISISNLNPGRTGLPPFFMLDYATVSYVGD